MQLLLLCLLANEFPIDQVKNLLPTCVPSPYLYYSLQSEWYVWHDDKQLLLQDFPQGSFKSRTDAFASPDGAVFHKRVHGSQAVVYQGARQVAEIPLSFGGRLPFAIYRNEHLYTGAYIGSDQLEVIKLDRSGKIIWKTTLKTPRVQPLYTKGRVFAAWSSNSLALWVPRSETLFYIAKGNLVKQIDLSNVMPEPMVSFRGTLFQDLMNLSEQPTLTAEEAKAYIESRIGDLARLEGMLLLKKDDRLGLLFHVWRVAAFDADITKKPFRLGPNRGVRVKETSEILWLEDGDLIDIHTLEHEAVYRGYAGHMGWAALVVDPERKQQVNGILER